MKRKDTDVSSEPGYYFFGEPVQGQGYSPVENLSPNSEQTGQKASPNLAQPGQNFFTAAQFPKHLQHLREQSRQQQWQAGQQLSYALQQAEEAISQARKILSCADALNQLEQVASGFTQHREDSLSQQQKSADTTAPVPTPQQEEEQQPPSQAWDREIGAGKNPLQ